jgi:hypothetical protein
MVRSKCVRRILLLECVVILICLICSEEIKYRTLMENLYSIVTVVRNALVCVLKRVEDFEGESGLELVTLLLLLFCMN